MEERIKGTVKWFDIEDGYGFITPDGGTEDVVVRESEVHSNELHEGDRVEFGIQYEDRGPQAINVVSLH